MLLLGLRLARFASATRLYPYFKRPSTRPSAIFAVWPRAKSRAVLCKVPRIRLCRHGRGAVVFRACLGFLPGAYAAQLVPGALVEDSSHGYSYLGSVLSPPSRGRFRGGSRPCQRWPPGGIPRPPRYPDILPWYGAVPRRLTDFSRTFERVSATSRKSPLTPLSKSGGQDPPPPPDQQLGLSPRPIKCRFRVYSRS